MPRGGTQPPFMLRASVDSRWDAMLPAGIGDPGHPTASMQRRPPLRQPGTRRIHRWIALGAIITSATIYGRVGAAAEEFPRPAIAWDPERYVCTRATGPVVIDGRPDEAVWSSAPWSSDFVDIQGGSWPQPRFRTRVKMLWDDLCFYIAAEMEEPDLWATLTERDAVIYHDHDFEVFIDPDGDTHAYYELEINALGTEWDLLLLKPYRDGGPAVNAWDIQGLRTAVQIDGTLNRPGDQDRGWSVEIALPWKVLGECAGMETPPRPGDRWRVNFSRVEWRLEARDGAYVKRTDPQTGRPLPEDNWVWSPQGLIAMHYPEMWGIVRFEEEREGMPADFDLLPEERAGAALYRIYYAERQWQALHGSWTDDLSDLGLTAPPLAGVPWPPRLEATSGLFEAILTLPTGETIRLREDGRLWVTP